MSGPSAPNGHAGADRLDDLLQAALGGGPAAPDDLVEMTLGRLRTEPHRGPRRWPTVLFAVAPVVIVAIGLALASGQPTEPLASPATPGTATAGPTAAADTPTPAATPDASADAAIFPAEVLGLPVISVEEALDIRGTSPLTSGPIAVRGWFTPWFVHSCPGPRPGRPTSPLLDACPFGEAALTAQPEILRGSWGYRGPTGPWLNPRFTWVDQPRFGTERSDVPTPVVVVGHFGDPAAAACPAELREACERAFVVETVAWSDPTSTPTQSPPPPAAEDSRVSCHMEPCLRAAGAVQSAVTDAYAAAARIVVTSGCPPWARCLYVDRLLVILVPPGWRGAAAELQAYAVDGARSDAPLTVRRIASPDVDWILVQIGGYALECGQLELTDCYEGAVRLAALALADEPDNPVTSIVFEGPCGSYDLRRADGSGRSAMITCLPPRHGPSATPRP